MYFKDKAYYVDKIKYYLGMTLTVIGFDAAIFLCILYGISR